MDGDLFTILPYLDNGSLARLLRSLLDFKWTCIFGLSKASAHRIQTKDCWEVKEQRNDREIAMIFMNQVPIFVMKSQLRR
jgi:hypothetical protein